MKVESLFFMGYILNYSDHDTYGNKNVQQLNMVINHEEGKDKERKSTMIVNK